MSKTVLTTLLLPPFLLERELFSLAGGRVLWRRTSDEERQVVVLEGGDEAARRAVVDGLSETFGPLLVRPGDVDPASEFVAAFRGAGMTLAAAESCTGGLISKLITDVPGSSDVFWGGVVSYANEAKTGLLGVPREVLENFGAVSRETVRAMAAGALKASGAGCAVAVSGVAGPAGGSPGKPVGTVWIAVGMPGGRFAEALFHFRGSRRRIRVLTAYYGLFMLEAFALRGESIDTKLPYEYI